MFSTIIVIIIIIIQSMPIYAYEKKLLLFDVFTSNIGLTDRIFPIFQLAFRKSVLLE